MEEVYAVLACFNILHYKSVDATQKCVDSLLKIKCIKECRVIIYDNGSNDGSADKLMDLYQKYDNVEIIESLQNDGFSVGNNKAFLYAKKYNPNYIIILNNDIEIRQKSFLIEVQKVDKNYAPYIIGPDVYNPRTKDHQSPLYKKSVDLDQIDYLINCELNDQGHMKEKQKIFIHAKKMRKIKRFIPGFLIDLRDYMLKKQRNWLYKERIMINPVLQGSCVIVTRRYIDNQDVVFEPDTRFYAEELLLALKCEKLKYKTIYSRNIKVIHWHGISSGFQDVPSIESLELKNQRMLNAYRIYRDALVNNYWKR